MPRFARPLRVLAVSFFVGVASLAAGCSGQNPYQAAESANSVQASGDAATPDTANVFTPDDQNVSSCVGTLERPDCGSKSKGGWRMYLTFAVLIGGMSFVFWRVVKSVRQRDAVVNDVGDDDWVSADSSSTDVSSDEPSESSNDTESSYDSESSEDSAVK
jgi:hypothetical protein